MRPTSSTKTHAQLPHSSLSMMLHILLPALYGFICHPVYILPPLIERISSSLFCRSRLHYDSLLYMNQRTHGVMGSGWWNIYNVFQLWSKWALLGHSWTLSYVVCKSFENVLFARRRYHKYAENIHFFNVRVCKINAKRQQNISGSKKRALQT